jgi:hypothetical protein
VFDAYRIGDSEYSKVDEGTMMTDKTTFGRLVPGGDIGRNRHSYEFDAGNQLSDVPMGVDTGVGSDKTVTVEEQWFKDGTGRKRINGGDWEPMKSSFRNGEPPVVLFDTSSVSEEWLHPLPPIHPPIDSIEVARYTWCLIVICGRHNASMPATPGAVWCCDWSKQLFYRYFEGQVVEGVPYGENV